MIDCSVGDVTSMSWPWNQKDPLLAYTALSKLSEFLQVLTKDQIGRRVSRLSTRIWGQMTLPIRLLFVEFGSFDPDRVRQAIEVLPLGPVEVERQVGSQAGEDLPVAEGLLEALQLLFQHRTICISVTPNQGEVKWVLLFAPNVMGSNIPMWHGMLELRSHSHELIFQNLKATGLQYVAVAKDDPFDLNERKLNPDQFPWTSPNFVAAALADDKGGYIENPPSTTKDE